MGKFSRYIFEPLGLNPQDMLLAAKWRIEMISTFLQEAGLFFWAKLLSLYLDTLKVYHGAAEIEPQFWSPITENKPWSKLSKNKKNKVMLPLNHTIWSNKITIFNPQYRDFIRIFPLKSLLLNSSGTILSQKSIRFIANTLSQKEIKIHNLKLTSF